MLPNNPETNSFTLPVDQLSYEEAFQQLETIVSSLEAEGQSLDSTLALYERGQALARHCASLLEQAELRVKQLSGEELIDITPSAG